LSNGLVHVCLQVRITVLGALKAPLPRDALRTVYLCDDGKGGAPW
jgi:hypothetical protein